MDRHSSSVSATSLATITMPIVRHSGRLSTVFVLERPCLVSHKTAWKANKTEADLPRSSRSEGLPLPLCYIPKQRRRYGICRARLTRFMQNIVTSEVGCGMKYSCEQYLIKTNQNGFSRDEHQFVRYYVLQAVFPAAGPSENPVSECSAVRNLPRARLCR